MKKPPHTIQKELSLEYIRYKRDIDTAIQRVLVSGRYILGEELERFEKRFAEFVGYRYCTGVGNGYDALYLSYKVLCSKRVCMINELHVSTANAAILAGCIVAEAGDVVDTIVGTIDPESPAIYSVDILDACQALETDSAKSYLRSSTAKLACFSFHPLKRLHCYGDGGAVCTNDRRLYEKLLRLRNHGRRGKSFRYGIGVNSRLDEIQAAVLNVMLDKIER